MFINEKHRLTTLQKQIIRWLRDEGGGCLPVNMIVANTKKIQTPYTDIELICERVCEAVDGLCRAGHAEVRDESRPRPKKPFSIYDFTPFSQLLEETDDGFSWSRGDAPVVALSDSGSLYAAAL